MNFFRKKICDLAEGDFDPSPGILPGNPFHAGIGCPDGIFFADRRENDVRGFVGDIFMIVIIINLITVTDRAPGQIGSHLPEDCEVRLPARGDHEFDRRSGGGRDHMNPYSVKIPTLGSDIAAKILPFEDFRAGNTDIVANRHGKAIRNIFPGFCPNIVAKTRKRFSHTDSPIACILRFGRLSPSMSGT